MDWSNDLILRFISNYKQYAIIWDPNHPEHKNKSCVMEAWEKVRQDMGTEVTVADLKRKKDALMATYRNLEKKVQIAKETGENYKPSWFCYNLMNNFLHNIYKPRSLQESYEEEPKDLFDSSNFEYEDFELPEQDIFIDEKPLINLKKRKVKCEDEIQPDLVNLSEINQLGQTYDQQNVQKQEADEISLYGELLVMKLRKFNRTNRLIICNKIDNLLFESELKLTSEVSSHQDPLADEISTTSQNGKKTIESAGHSSPSHMEFTEHIPN